jgi:type II secretory pathway component PulF
MDYFRCNFEESTNPVESRGKSREGLPRTSAFRDRGTRSKRAVLEFTEMMELFIESGLSLKDALEMAASIDRTSDRTSAAGLPGRLFALIGKGSSFAQAVSLMKDTFSPIYRGMIRVGDRAGSVEAIFPRLSAYLSDQKKLRDKISAALAYPLLVFGTAVSGCLGLVVFVIPKLEAIFAGFAGDAAERIQANIHTMGNALLVLLVLLCVCVLGFFLTKWLAGVNEDFACFTGALLFRLPLIGKFLSCRESLNFAFAMEVLTGGGVPVETAIAEAAAVITNRAYRRALLGVREKLINGFSISRAFAEERLFPVYMSRWIAVGERAGKTEKIFFRLRSFFQDEIERRTARLLLLIEPALTAAVGIFMLTMISGIIVPLFSIYGNII